MGAGAAASATMVGPEGSSGGADAAGGADPASSAPRAAGGGAGRRREKSMPLNSAPQPQRVRSGGFSRSQTGQTRTCSKDIAVCLAAPGHLLQGEPATRAQRLDHCHVAATRNADQPHAAALEAACIRLPSAAAGASTYAA